MSDEIQNDPDITFVDNKELFQIITTNKNIFLDENAIMYSDLPEQYNNITDPIFMLRAIKSNDEIKHFTKIHNIDSHALTIFLFSCVRMNEYSEISASDALLSIRSNNELFIGNSFASISAYGDSSAFIHYNPKKGKNKKITDGIYLLDSGGHYIGGTTDVTRTVIVGNPVVSSELKTDATNVLKGFIDLHMCVFPEGTTGSSLDSIARQHLWHTCYNYPHGTGHGVGNYLNVHEGPQSFSSDVALRENMVISIEPGCYRENKYGIRIENVVYVKKHSKGWLMFQPLTWVPIDLTMIDLPSLSKKQLHWLSWYTYEVLAINSKAGLDSDIKNMLIRDLEKITLEL